jgi:sterol desaturase/sphingolipid hydroxylase (fatty acid hydroxylase superfamily)
LVVISIVFVPLERLASLHRQPIGRKALLLDVSYYFLNALLVGAVLAIPLAGVAWLLHFIVPSSVQALGATLPVPLKFIAALVLGEIGGYWGHRIQHEIPWLWRLHAIHHSAEQIDFMVNVRAHPLDLLLTRITGYIPLYAFGLLSPFPSASDPALAAFVFGGTLWAYFIHSNIRLRFGWLEHVLASPAYHHWHHTKHDHVNHNYATVLPFVDRLFGTHHLPKGEWPAEYGSDTKVPDTLAGQLAFPFRRKH